MKSRLIYFGVSLLIMTHSFAQDQQDSEKQIENKKRAAQLSLVYPLGTNGIDADQYINNFSLNVWAGYAAGVQGFELAGLGNLIRQDVQGFQGAGLANVVGRDSRGFQVAGLTNLVKQDVSGIQLAGIGNLAGGSITGMQASGIFSFTNGNVTGSQLSGQANFAKGDVSGGQVSSLANFAGGKVKGLQLGTLVNYAGVLSGVQIGLVNIVRKYEKGATIGFINIVKGGYSKFELSGDDITLLNGGYKSGTKRLYGIVTAGIDPDKERWVYGLGFGTQIDFKGRFFGNVESTLSHVLSTERKLDGNYLLQRLYLNMGYTVFGGVQVVAGPVLNIYFEDFNNDPEDTFSDIKPDNAWWETSNDNWNIYLYPGYKVAVRF